MKKNKNDFIIDDNSPDLSKYDKYSEQEIQQMIDEMEERHREIEKSKHANESEE